MRPAFTDHFMTDYRLQRIEPVGVGAAARFRVREATRWMETVIEVAERPHLIREQGRGGRSNRVDRVHGLGARRGRLAASRARPRSPSGPSPRRTPTACASCSVPAGGFAMTGSAPWRACASSPRAAGRSTGSASAAATGCPAFAALVALAEASVKYACARHAPPDRRHRSPRARRAGRRRGARGLRRRGGVRGRRGRADRGRGARLQRPDHPLPQPGRHRGRRVPRRAAARPLPGCPTWGCSW